ncbi:hypothetical protein PL78_00225 [Yersinia entomophaga]|uniref:Uncharacterized protein n=1 Tax=Yersinia entomophaga TaxID=935293 RepID=A0ABN4PR67_YERET|nr:hypothetical protein [Yersinia entomophaga]ANI28266.1 hypothetical protein PL78_00225 [Yersinia entomophaga]OWF84917.1 hypothetical protein B4914_18320 [Yersinia entomophaga]
MRFYDIQIYDQKGALFRQYSSLKNGVFNPGGLMVEFDIQRFGESTPQGQSCITVWGVSPQEMQQAQQNMFGMTVKMFVGMSKGLPLSKPSQKGLVLEGTIWQAFGNWQGTELRLDLIVVAGPTSTTSQLPMAPLNLTMPWGVGQQLSVALTQCFQTLGGSYTHNINVSNRLVLPYSRPMFCGALSQLASDLKNFSKTIIKDSSYSGVEITIVNGKEIRVWDNDYINHSDKTSLKSATYRNGHPTQIEFTDLIGQPTWIRFGTITVPCVMRADIQVGDHILMPKKSRAMIQASSFSQFRNDSAFTGEFIVQSVRLVGNSRQPDANSWVTIIEAYPSTELAKK